MTRILVVGTSGSGKTTLAAEIARQLGVPHIELDALHWLPGWVASPEPELRGLVADAAAGENWVADGNYSMVRDILWPRGTMVVWLNYSRRVVMWRVLQRTVRRALFRTPLFSGNRESLERFARQLNSRLTVMTLPQAASDSISFATGG